MQKLVLITEKETDRVIAEYRFQFLIADSSDEDYCDKAWDSAIDEGLVDPKHRSDYKIEVEERIPTNKH